MQTETGTQASKHTCEDVVGPPSAELGNRKEGCSDSRAASSDTSDAAGSSPDQAMPPASMATLAAASNHCKGVHVMLPSCLEPRVLSLKCSKCPTALGGKKKLADCAI